MIALVDADILVYRAGYTAEEAIDWGDGQFSINASLEVGITEFDALVEGVARKIDADQIVLALSDTKDNFRKAVYPDYKKPRVNASVRKNKPLLFKALRDHARKAYTVVQRPGLEADDVLGILATGQVKGFKGDKIVCSIDKDLRTVPCELYNWDTGSVDVIDELQADRNFYTQVLTGDTTDNFPGCPGIGPKRAAKLLEVDGPEHELWAVVLAAYAKAGLTEADAIVQARCARILRASDYNFRTKEVILWTPPTIPS